MSRFTNLENAPINFGGGGGSLGWGGGFPGGYGFGGGCGGGIAPFGLFGLVGGFGDFGRDRRRGDDDCCNEGRDGRNSLAILAAVANAKDTTVAEGRSLAAAICDSEKTNLQQFYAAAIQTANSTQAIKDQATAFAIVADKRFDDLAAAGVAQTAAIIAKLNQTELDTLRDQLHGERRRGDHQDIAISIQNSQNQLQAQAQAQFQNIKDDQKNWFNQIASQLNKTSNDVINFGTMAASGNQANQQTNVK